VSQIEGLEGIGEQVAQIDLGETEEEQAAEEASLSAVPDPEPELEFEQVTITGPDGVAHDVTGAFKAAANGELFDAGSYQDSGIPVVDGQATDKLVFAFGGSLPFEATDGFAQELFERFQLGASVTLQVEAVVMKKDGAYKVNAKDEETITGGVRLKVTSLYVKSPESL
jgi:hypothetical protein